MSLADDIARVAALRGRPVAEMQAAEQQRRRVGAEQVRMIFSHGHPDKEMKAFDRLPAASRRALTELPVCASSLQYTYLLSLLDEQALIAAVKAEIPAVLGMLARHEDHN